MLRLTVGVLLLSLVAGSRCPAQQGCGEEQTCCQIHSGEFNCCPFHQAVCCEDLIHCCPHGKKCNIAAQTCDDPSGSVPWLEKEPSRPIRIKNVPEDSVVPCNETAGCPDETTCCQDKEGVWRCCPLPEAVCCEDFIHCCPHGKKCNVAAQTCEDPSGSVPWLEKVPSRTIRIKNVPEDSVVPCNETAGCPDETTCCKDKEGVWRCCPLPEAVCCEDFIHCCPHGKKCNVAAQTCDDPSGSVPWLDKEPSRPIRIKNVLEDSVVPCNETVGCPDETTCCKDKEGVWRCCPLPEAVCCEDFIHCCPHGKKCNVAAQTCEDPSGSVPWLEKVPSRTIRIKNVPEDSVVPCNETAGCPDETTCCKDKEGVWRCCPLPEAVCCEDFIHCCPHGKKCNVAAQTCDDPSGSVPWLDKEQSRPIRIKNVLEDSVVPCNETVGCPDETTCCQDKEGVWRCCPLPEAVCCEDLIHCCPHGKKCNIAAQTCDDPSGSVPWLEKEPSRPIRIKNVPEDSVVPCNETAGCPDETTCCKDKEGVWRCCPLPEAVCCEDFIHCCPHGKKCNVAAQTCDDPSGSVPWLDKEPSRPIVTADQKASVNEVSVDCDPQVSCPAHTTCCFMDKSKKWGCCPLKEATCCEGGEYCCPKGYMCQGQQCLKNSWVKFDSVNLARQQIQTNIDCGGGFSCRDSETCCRTSPSSWGCCPFPKAVCCSDMQHCCPAGYTCDGSSSCTPGFNWDMFFSKMK